MKVLPEISLTPPSPDPAQLGLSLRDITVVFDRSTKVLDGLNLDVSRGEIVALVGASGCGKSTLLRAIAGLQSIQAGAVRRATSDDIPGAGNMAFVFQDATLLPWRTVFENVQLPIELHSSHTSNLVTPTELRDRVSSSLHSVQLPEDCWSKFPRQLSGGMRMRTSIARALVTNPQLLLLDEPFAALDDLLRNRLNMLLLELWQSKQQTILFVTHNIAEAVWLSHRIAVLGRGKVIQLMNNPLAWPRTMEQRSGLEFAQQYGRVSRALLEANT